MPSSTDVTVLIAARNAAATIGRALRSVEEQPYAKILLLNHASTDGTSEAARRCGVRKLEILSLPADWTLGRVRQAGLESLDTPLGIWLDADDAFEPKRIPLLIEALESDNSVLAFDEAHLFDGPSGRPLRSLPFPAELRSSSDLVRCFGRNLLPAVGVPAFRTDFAQRLGYDGRLQGAEDYDFLLRALMQESRISLVRAPLYRVYAYPSSLSRHLHHQRRMCALALSKHHPKKVQARLERSGLEPAERLWVLVEFFTFRCEWRNALETLDRLETIAPRWECEPYETWRRTFQRGTLLLFQGDPSGARTSLGLACTLRLTAETLNNFGVALRDLGQEEQALAHFQRALELLPEYRDARLNLEAPGTRHITPLPLRTSPSRSTY